MHVSFMLILDEGVPTWLARVPVMHHGNLQRNNGENINDLVIENICYGIKVNVRQVPSDIFEQNKFFVIVQIKFILPSV